MNVRICSTLCFINCYEKYNLGEIQEINYNIIFFRNRKFNFSSSTRYIMMSGKYITFIIESEQEKQWQKKDKIHIFHQHNGYIKKKKNLERHWRRSSTNWIYYSGTFISTLSISWYLLRLMYLLLVIGQHLSLLVNVKFGGSSGNNSNNMFV